MIKCLIGTMVILLGVALNTDSKAVAESCGRSVAAHGCSSVHLRPGQVRRINRRAARAHRQAVRHSYRGHVVSSCGQVHTEASCGRAQPPRCGGVAIAAPVTVAVNAYSR